jgi:hypothetical protein
MENEPSNLQQAMAKAEARETPALTDASRLLAAADKLLRFQQASFATQRASYEASRTERVNFYRIEVSRLQDEAEAELLKMDQKWHEEENRVLHLIGKLKALRAG